MRLFESEPTRRKERVVIKWTFKASFDVTIDVTDLQFDDTDRDSVEDQIAQMMYTSAENQVMDGVEDVWSQVSTNQHKITDVEYEQILHPKWVEI